MTDAMLRSKKGFIVVRFIFAKGADFEWVIMEYAKDTLQLPDSYQINTTKTEGLKLSGGWLDLVHVEDEQGLCGAYGAVVSIDAVSRRRLFSLQRSAER